MDLAILGFSRRSPPAARVHFAAVLLAVLAAGTPTPAQGGDAPEESVYVQLVNTVDVRLVELHVVVTDGKGRLVPGLGRRDFEILQGGATLPVLHFAAHGGAGGGSGPVDGAGPEPARAPLLLVVCVDRSFLEPGQLGRVLDGLEPFLETGLPSEVRLMLVSAGQHLEILQEPTLEPAALTARFETLAGLPGRSQLAAEYQQVVRAVERTLLMRQDFGIRDRSQMAQALLSQINAFSSSLHNDVAWTADQLARLTDLLAGIAGRKEVLYVGGGIPASAGRDLFDLWRGAFGSGSAWRQLGGGDAGSADAVPEGARDLGTEALLRDVALRAAARGVTFHTLAAGGLGTPSSFVAAEATELAPESGGAVVSSQINSSRRSQGRDALETLAGSTGGRAMVFNRALDDNLAELAAEWGRGYTLAFAAPEQTGGKPLPLQVRLRDEGRKRRLRYRRAVLPRSRDQETADRTVSALLTRAADNRLGVEVIQAERVAGEAPGGAASSVGLRVQVPLAGLALLAEGRSHLGQVSIFFTSGDLDRGVEPVQKAIVPVRIDNQDLLTALGRSVEYRFDVPLRPGVRRVAVSVRDDFAPETSTLVLPLRGVEEAAALRKASPHG